MSIEEPPVAGASRVPAGTLGAWWREGARSALLRAPRWEPLHARPVVLALLLATWVLLAAALQRLLIAGPVLFNPQAIHSGWIGSLLALWLCWLVASRAQGDALQQTASPPAATLFGLLLAQGLCIEAASGAVLVPLAHAGWLEPDAMPRGLAWALWLAPWGWALLAQCLLLLRFAPPRRGLRGFVVLASGVPLALSLWAEPPSLWHADASAERAAAPHLRVTQEVVERQASLLDGKLRELQPQRAGVVDLYALTFAPYATEDVFKRESAMVADVMRERFDAQGKVVQLVNHRDTALDLPWATPLNLQRAIERVAAVMDRDEDVLFVHLTSHGAGNGELSASFWPLHVDTVTPLALKRWLDAAGVRFRVISVSACYSGSWIEPLAGDGTLIMTASDATHTSYGCGRKSELTFFGRALYHEQLRSTWSFERAHAQARTVIEQREREAGKTDGYSNPQLSMGAEIRDALARLEARLAGDSVGGVR
jgi:Peptidase C13 family